MSIGSFVVAPPAFFFLRKTDPPRARHRADAVHRRHAHYRDHAGIAAGHARRQGVRARRRDAPPACRRASSDVEHESNKMARVANRASPMMEMLGGFAIALATIYGGYRVIEIGATPGEFVSFLAAFLLAYEPAKRLARLNIDLNNNLVGVRVLYEVIDSPPGEPDDDDRPPLELSVARVEFADVRFRLSRRRAGAPRHELRRPARQGHGAGRPVRRRQVDGAEPAAAVLRSRQRPHPDRRPGHRRGVAPLAARPDRLCRPAGASVPRHHPREHRASASSAPAMPRSPPRPRRHTRTISSSASRTATTRRSASTACSFPAASASASRSRAH